MIAAVVRRRLSSILGFALTAIACLLQAVVPTFPAAVLGAVIWGVGVPCISGSYDAWLADELGQETKTSFMCRYRLYPQERVGEDLRAEGFPHTRDHSTGCELAGG